MQTSEKRFDRNCLRVRCTLGKFRVGSAFHLHGQAQEGQVLLVVPPTGRLVARDLKIWRHPTGPSSNRSAPGFIFSEPTLNQCFCCDAALRRRGTTQHNCKGGQQAKRHQLRHLIAFVATWIWLVWIGNDLRQHNTTCAAHQSSKMVFRPAVWCGSSLESDVTGKLYLCVWRLLREMLLPWKSTSHASLSNLRFIQNVRCQGIFTMCHSKLQFSLRLICFRRISVLNPLELTDHEAARAGHLVGAAAPANAEASKFIFWWSKAVFPRETSSEKTSHLFCFGGRGWQLRVNIFVSDKHWERLTITQNRTTGTPKRLQHIYWLLLWSCCWILDVV